ncbi:MAG: TonB-dependent receptor [Bacteroidota bacterium]
MKQFFQSNLLLIAMLLLPGLMLGQRTVSGTVTDADNGDPLIGVNVVVMGAESTGAITDFDGKFSVNVPEGFEKLLFTYTGFADQEVAIDGRSTIDVQLTSGIDIEEVIVIGYGTVKKEDKTGSVDVVNSEDFNTGAISGPQDLLTGKVAGVNISTTSGEPGRGAQIRIRGGTSFSASNEPLFVVDGVPFSNDGNPGSRNPLNFMNPNDIESVTVLKDASATAIYGSRAANGVIIITTKKGVAGAKPSINYDGYFSTRILTSELTNLNAEQFRNFVTFADPSRLESLGTANTDWYDEMTESAMGHSHSLSLTGGAANMGYRVSLGYQKFDGVVTPASNENVNLGFSLNQNMFDDRLKMNLNYKGGYTRDVFDPGLIWAAWTFDPTQPVLDPENTDFGGYFEHGVSLAPRNPVSAANQIESFGKSFRNLASFDAQYEIIDGLSVKINYGVDYNSGGFRKFEPTTYLNTQISDRNGNIFIQDYVRSSQLVEITGNYNKTIGEQHDIGLLAGYSWQDFRFDEPQLTAFDLATDIFGFDNIGVADEFDARTFSSRNRLISFFGRANYAFANRYLVTVSLRADGSTRFGDENKWGIFPSAAVAWKILEEPFAAGLTNIFSDLKLRVGYGKIGNQEIGDFGYLPTYQLSDGMTQFQFGDEFVTTARPNAYDANLKWEETTNYNIGLDFGFANGRVNGSIEYYFKDTKDLLATVPVPAGTNLSDRVLTNIGQIQNQGIELTLSTIVLDIKDLRWDVNANAAWNKNEVKAISSITSSGILTGGISGGVGNNVQIIQVGQPINSFYLFEHLLDGSGNPLADGIDHNDDGSVDLADMYADLNGDGMVNEEDRRAYKKPTPDLLLGFSSNVSYKEFDLSFTLRGGIGGYVYDNNASSRGYFNHLSLNPAYNNNIHASALVTNFQDPQFFSDYYLQNGSFMRLENISLGYNVPNIGDRTLRLYVSGQNLFVLTNYTGIDPEVENGIDQTPFPRTKGIIFGVSLGL